MSPPFREGISTIEFSVSGLCPLPGLSECLFTDYQHNTLQSLNLSSSAIPNIVKVYSSMENRRLHGILLVSASPRYYTFALLEATAPTSDDSEQKASELEATSDRDCWLLLVRGRNENKLKLKELPNCRVLLGVRQWSGNIGCMCLLRSNHILAAVCTFNKIIEAEPVRDDQADTYSRLQILRKLTLSNSLKTFTVATIGQRDLLLSTQFYEENPLSSVGELVVYDLAEEVHGFDTAVEGEVVPEGQLTVLFRSLHYKDPKYVIYLDSLKGAVVGALEDHSLPSTTGKKYMRYDFWQIEADPLPQGAVSISPRASMRKVKDQKRVLCWCDCSVGNYSGLLESGFQLLVLHCDYYTSEITIWSCRK